jgi:L-ribulose-5-phosphate 3-epimerase UlaE
LKYGIRQKSLLLSDKELVTAARDIGFDGVELNTIRNFREDRLWSAQRISEIKKFITDSKIRIYSISLSAIRDYNFTMVETEKRKIALDLIEHLINVGSELGISVLLLPLLELDKKEIGSRLLAGLKKAAEHARRKDIFLAIETVLSPDDSLKLIQNINSEYVKICFDTGIINTCGYNIYESLVLLEGVIAEIHVKDSFAVSRLPEQITNFHSLQSLRKQLSPPRKLDEDGGTKWAVQLGKGTVDFKSFRRAINRI